MAIRKFNFVDSLKCESVIFEARIMFGIIKYKLFTLTKKKSKSSHRYDTSNNSFR